MIVIIGIFSRSNVKTTHLKKISLEQIISRAGSPGKRVWECLILKCDDAFFSPLYHSVVRGNFILVLYDLSWSNINLRFLLYNHVITYQNVKLRLIFCNFVDIKSLGIFVFVLSDISMSNVEKPIFYSKIAIDDNSIALSRSVMNFFVLRLLLDFATFSVYTHWPFKGHYRQNKCSVRTLDS